MTDKPVPRRFAVLGDQSKALELVLAIERSASHEIVAAAMTPLFPKASRYDHWQPLVTGGEFDAVILAGYDAECLEGARHLAAAGKTLIIEVSPSLPADFVYEMSLFDAEGEAALIPLFPGRATLSVRELQRQLRTGGLGKVVSVEYVRDYPLDTHFLSEGRLVDDEHFADRLFIDIDLLRLIGGDYKQVTAIRAGTDENRFASQTLQLAGDGLPDATCVHRVAPESPDWSVTVTAEGGSLVIRPTADGHELLKNGEAIARDGAIPEVSPWLELIDKSSQRVQGSAGWSDVVRLYDIREAIGRSLRRRRTIDLHFETTSERSLFKTQMATIGCFVLVYTLFASVLLLLAGAVLDPRDQLQRQAEAAGFVIPQDDFDPESGQLTQRGERRLADIADRWQSTSAVVVIEGDSSSDGPEGDASPNDQARLEAVQRELSGLGAARVSERTVVRQLAGEGFQRLMTIGRVIAFAPVGMFLAMQLLLLIARPAQQSEPRGANSAAMER